MIFLAYIIFVCLFFLARRECMHASRGQEAEKGREKALDQDRSWSFSICFQDDLLTKDLALPLFQKNFPGLYFCILFLFQMLDAFPHHHDYHFLLYYFTPFLWSSHAFFYSFDGYAYAVFFFFPGQISYYKGFVSLKFFSWLFNLFF